MNRSARLAFLSAASLLTSGVLLAESAPVPFAEATFTEIVNDVQIVSGANAQGRKVAKSDKFLAPDLVKTGRKSRAELKAADGTVARVGSNAVFSFDKSSRSMNLQSGSVLFHSPTGKGGGTVVTNSATASVIGTTIMVTATSDGGFKLLVLEGVAKVTLNGVVTQIMPGQMTFVLPAKSGETAKLGPVLNFDLDALVKDSSLVAGFEDSLASMGKIKDAIAEQGLKIEDGDLRKTGLFIIGANDENAFNVADAATIRQTVIQQQQGDQARLAESLRASFSFNGEGAIPESFIFRTPVFIDPAVLGLNIPAGDVNGGFVGLLVGHLDLLNTSVFNLGFIDGAADTITVGGFQSGEFDGLFIRGNITFNGLSRSHNLRIVGGTLHITDGSQIDVVFDNATLTQPVSVEFVSLTGVTHTGVGFFNTTGNIEISAITGDLTLDAVTATAGTRTTTFAPLLDGPLDVTPGTLAPAKLELRAPLGILTLIGGSYQASGDIRAEGAHGVSATNATSFSADGRIEIVSAAATTLDAAILNGAGVKIQGDTGVTLSGATSVSSQGSVNITSTTGIVALGDAIITASAPIQSPGGITSGGIMPGGITASPNSDITISGNGVTGGIGSITASGGSVSIAGGAAGVILTGTSISGDTINIDGADITLDGGSVSASKIYIERSPGVLASTLTVKNGASLSAFGGNFTEAGVNLRAGTIVLDGAQFTDGTTVTLRVTTGRLSSTFDGLAGTVAPETGKANIFNTFYDGEDVLTTGKVWSPKDNIGDVTAPIHILDATTDDFHGTKKEFALARPLLMDGASTFTPNSNSFFSADNQEQDGGLVTYSELGFAVDPGLPSVFYAGENSHSAYEVHGVFAKDMTLNGATVDLSAFAIDPQQAYGAHADVVAKDMHISGTVTLVGSTVSAGLELPGTIEVRAINFHFATGSSLIFGDAPDATRGSNELLLVSGTPLTLDHVTLRNDSGNFDVRAFGDLTLIGGSVSGGGVDAQQSPVSGTVALSAQNSVIVSGGASLAGTSSVNITASTGDISVGSGVNVVAGNYDFQAEALLASGQVSMSANTAGKSISLLSATVQAYGDSATTSGSIYLSSDIVNLKDSGLRVIDQAATALTPSTPVYSGYININSAMAVTIDGGYLKASGISINATDANNGVVTLKGNPTFVASGGTGIAIAAKTVNISDVNFPANTAVTLRSGDGSLNLGSSRFGSVNFVTGVSYAGQSLVGAGGAIGSTEIGHLNTLVSVQNSSAILVGGQSQSLGITGNTANPSAAPIQIQTVLAP